MHSHFSPDSWVTPFGLIFIGAILVAWVLARRNAKSIAMDASHIDLLMPITMYHASIGEALELSRERVRQIESRALERMRRLAERAGLGEGLDSVQPA